MLISAINLLASSAATAMVIHFHESADITALLPVLMLSAATAFAHLSVPHEHGIVRRLYRYVRRLLFATASATLVIAADLSVFYRFLDSFAGSDGKMPKHQLLTKDIPWEFADLGVLGDIFLALALAVLLWMFLATLFTITIWRGVRANRVRYWIKRQLNSGNCTRFGLHIVESRRVPGIESRDIQERTSAAAGAAVTVHC